VKGGLEHLLARNGGETNVAISNLAAFLPALG
jgi:hypothetical protein